MPILKEQVSKQDMLKAIQAIPLRAERQTASVDVLENFVPVVDFDALSTPNTQIVYGRNGTGKSHFLAAYYQYCETTFENSKILPVYIDFKDLDLGPVLPSISLEDLILRFYRLFLYKVVDRLKSFSDKVIIPSLLERVFGGAVSERKDKIDESINNIYSYLSLEHFDEYVKDYVRKIEIDRTTSSELKGRIGISSKFSISKQDASLGASLGITAEDIQKEKEKIELVYRGLTVIDYEAIRAELEQLIELCGARAIVLLVDEWSAVSLSIQPILAEMIRKTLVISNKISLKIVAIKFLSQTSAAIDPPQRIGLQPGIDITELTDLDMLLNFDANEQVVKDFLTIVAYKHTCQEIPTLKNYSVKEFEDYLCGELFDSEAAFFELMRASEGNTRDFLVILAACCSIANLSDVKKASLVQTIKAASSHFNSNKAEVIRSNHQTQNLYNKIFQRVIQTKRKAFLISLNKAENNFAIQDLWNYRFIHLLDPSLVIVDENAIVNEYAVYTMDYGKLLTLKTQKAGQDLIDLIVATTARTLEFTSPPTGWLFEIVTDYLKSTVIGGKLRTMAGSAMVSRTGIEKATTNDMDYLLKNYVIDDLLSE